VSVGTSTLVGSRPEILVREATRVLDGNYKRGGIPELWDGRAAERIAAVLEAWRRP
jgi:UDP-N-acetylglucosamine 2-epimerase (non-hydrolysing)